MCRYLNKVSDSLVRNLRRKRQRRKALDSVDNLISEEAIVKYMSHPTVMMVHDDLMRDDFQADILNGLVYRDSDIYLMSRHMAMFLLIRYAKRPVVISSLKCSDMETAFVKRANEESQKGFDHSTPIYRCVPGDYACTEFKTCCKRNVSRTSKMANVSKLLLCTTALSPY